MKKIRLALLCSACVAAAFTTFTAQVNAQEELAPEFIFSFSTQFPETDATDVPEENLREGVIIADGPPIDQGGPGTLGQQLNLALEDGDPDVPAPLVASVSAQGITFTVSATSVDENGNFRDAAFSASGTTAGVDTFDPNANGDGRILVNAFETLVITMTFDPSLEVTMTEIDLEFVVGESQQALLTVGDNPELGLFFVTQEAGSVPGYDFLTDTYTPPEEIVISSGDSIILGSNRASGIKDLTLRIAQDPKPLVGDVNLDGFVNFGDISAFISLLSTPDGFQAEADINGDLVVDFSDIGPFIGLLSSGS